MHQHRHEQALRTVIDPDHEHPVRRQPCEQLKEQDRQPERSGVSARPENDAEVVSPPQEPDAESRTEDAVPLPQHGHGKPRPAQLLQEPATNQSIREAHHQEGGPVARDEDAG